MPQPPESQLDLFPDFLRTTDAFSSHLADLFLDESNQAKGDAFLEFAMRLVVLCDFWRGLSEPEPSPSKTHDHGVDFTAKELERGVLRVAGQSKYRIRQIAEIDSIISKFHDYETRAAREQSADSSQLSLQLSEVSQIVFVIVTSSRLRGMLERYRDSRLASLPYFEKLEREKRIEIIDGERLLGELQSLYRQSYIPAPNILLTLQTRYLESGGVFLSIVTGETLAGLYAEHGSSLFFENIREFLGEAEERGGEAVNKDISRTLTQEPDKMLGRNNGITFKAERVTPQDDSHLQLENSSIVNGCQTTMCIVNAGESAHRAEVVVKIVEGVDSWDIAKAANNQNRVSRIELELARFLRPRLVRKAATDMGFSLPLSEEKQTVSNVLESIHRNRVSYEAIRLLYVGMFSRSPKNMWESNYSEVRIDVLERFTERNRDETLLRTLFQLLVQMRDAIAELEERHRGESYAPLFKRFFDDRNPRYQCFLAILAACGCVESSVVDKSGDTKAEYEHMAEFIDKLAAFLETSPRGFRDMLQEAFIVVADRIFDKVDEDESDRAMLQVMYRETESMSKKKAFERVLSKLRLHTVQRQQ